MITPDVNVKNARDWVVAFSRMPDRAARNFTSALGAAVAEFDRVMIDSKYRFKLPRSARTGNMANRKIREVHAGQAIIGHQVDYAEKVFKLHRREGNNFMKRFIGEAKPQVEEHFEDALGLTVQATANDVRI